MPFTAPRRGSLFHLRRYVFEDAHFMQPVPVPNPYPYPYPYLKAALLRANPYLRTPHPLRGVGSGTGAGTGFVISFMAERLRYGFR